MIAVQYRNTMASAKQIVPDPEATITRPRRREKLIEMSRKWQESQVAREAAEKRRADRAKAMLAAKEAPPSVKAFLTAFAVTNGFTYEDLIGRKKHHKLVECRWDAVAEVYRRFDGAERGLNWVGRQFGGRDHTSIMNALRKREII